MRGCQTHFYFEIPITCFTDSLWVSSFTAGFPEKPGLSAQVQTALLQSFTQLWSSCNISDRREASTLRVRQCHQISVAELLLTPHAPNFVPELSGAVRQSLPGFHLGYKYRFACAYLSF